MKALNTFAIRLMELLGRSMQAIAVASQGQRLRPSTSKRFHRGLDRSLGPVSRTSFHSLRHAVNKGYRYESLTTGN